jgi:signal transduction histidine kinase
VDNLVSGDEARLRQILMNLIGNAVKFTNQGSVSIIMRPYTAAKSSADVSSPVQWVEFEITDTGEGIPPGREEELFRPFTQLSPYMTRNHDGTGLGLSICKLLVELMGGNIRFEHAASGQGATFIFTVCLMIPQTGTSVSDSMYTGNSQVRSGG